MIERPDMSVSSREENCQDVDDEKGTQNVIATINLDIFLIDHVFKPLSLICID